jgi:hypothetical protein
MPPSRSAAATLLLAGFVGLLLASSPAPADATLNAFNATGSMFQGRYGSAAAQLPNGKVLVTGGNDIVNRLASSELYDPDTGTWASTGSLNEPRWRFAATQLADGRMMVVGGESAGGGKLDSAEIYDPATGVWTTVAPMPIARWSPSAVTMPDGKVLVIGGWVDPGSSTANAGNVYDPATDTWSWTPATPGYNAWPGTGVVVLTTGKVLVTSVNFSGGGLDNLLYDPVAGTFSVTDTLTSSQGFGRVVALAGGKALLAGGVSGITAVNTAEVFDSAGAGGTGTFTPTGTSMINARSFPGASLLPDGRVLLAGGFTQFLTSSTALATAEIFDPSGSSGAGSFSATASMSSARGGMPALTLDTGQVLVPGGASPGPVASATAETYDTLSSGASSSPASIAFGERTAGTGPSPASPFAVASDGTYKLTIRTPATALSGADPGSFVVDGGSCAPDGGVSVPVGNACTVNVRFNPSTSGTKTAVLTLNTSAGPRTVTLSGTGTSAPGPEPTPSNAVSVERTWVAAGGRLIRSRVRVPGPGILSQIGTRSRTAARTVTACRARARRPEGATTMTLECRLNSSARAARKQRAIRVNVRTTFTPTGGSQRTVIRRVIVPRSTPGYTG